MAIIISSFADIFWIVNYRENNVQMYQLWKLQPLFVSLNKSWANTSCL